MARFPGRRVIVALGLIFSLVVVTLLGLHYHIRTIAISTEISRLKRDLRVLKRDNRRMLVDILHATSLSEVESRAAEMGLVPMGRVRYLEHNALESVE